MNIGTRPCQIQKITRKRQEPDAGAYMKMGDGAIQSRIGAGYGRMALRKWQLGGAGRRC